MGDGGRFVDKWWKCDWVWWRQEHAGDQYDDRCNLRSQSTVCTKRNGMHKTQLHWCKSHTKLQVIRISYWASTTSIATRGLLQTEFLVKFSETVRNRRTCHPDMNLTPDFNVASDAGSCKKLLNLCFCFFWIRHVLLLDDGDMLHATKEVLIVDSRWNDGTMQWWNAEWWVPSWVGSWYWTNGNAFGSPSSGCMIVRDRQWHLFWKWWCLCWKWWCSDDGLSFGWLRSVR